MFYNSSNYTLYYIVFKCLIYYKIKNVGNVRVNHILNVRVLDRQMSVYTR